MKFEYGKFDEKDISVAPIDFAFCARDIDKKRDEADKVIKEIEKTTDELTKENEREAHMKNKFQSYKKLQLSESLFEDFEDEHDTSDKDKKKKVYYVRTNANDFLLTDDGKIRRILDNEYALCPRDDAGNCIDIDKFLKSVEDDSSWDEYTETADELIGDGKVLAQRYMESFADEHIGKPSHKCKQCVKSVRKPLKEALSTTDVARFIKNAVKGLLNEEGTNYRYILDDRLAIFVGWSDGYDENDDTIIHNPSHKTSGINAGIKVWTSDDMWTDYDYLNFPYYENGDIIDTAISISPNDDYASISKYLIDKYESLKELEIDEDGLIKENDIEEEYNKTTHQKKLKESTIDEYGRYQVVTFSFDSGTDEKEDAKTLKDAKILAKKYIKDDYYDSVAIYDRRTKKFISLKNDFNDYIQESAESPMNESYVLLDLADFKPWSGAVPYWDKIVDADKIDEFDTLLDDLYPDGIREVDLNDWLWFEGDDVLDMLGISDEEEDDEEESDEDEED